MAGVEQFDASIPGTHGGIYRDGPFEVETVSVRSSSDRCCKGTRIATANKNSQVPGLAPKPLVVALPKEAGDYPVVQFQHGFTLRNAFYTQLISHIASHGFIVVAPQMYTISGSDAMLEIEEAAAILSWMPTGFLPSLPERFSHHRPTFSQVALVGHSRGGKVVFGLALGLRSTPFRFSALVGLDPVDGMGIGAQTHPPILCFSPDSLHFGTPTLLIGTGLGPQRRNFLFPACAPEGVSHRAFYHDTAAPCVHVVAARHGHMDFLDDHCGGAVGKLTQCVCLNGAARQPMRRFAGGMVVAFLRAVMFADAAALEMALATPQLAPVPLESPEWKGKLPGAPGGQREDTEMQHAGSN